MFNVYSLKIEGEYSFEKINNSDFKDEMTEKEKNRIVEIYTAGKNVFNGSAVRLEKINIDKKINFKISKSSYFDLLSTNIIYFKKEEILDRLNNLRLYEDVKLIETIINKIETFSSNDSLENILNNNYLANTIAISVLVQDINGNFGLIRRGKNVAIGSGLLGVTASGGVDEVDYSETNPILSCVYRELQEELNIIPNSTKISYVVMSKSKMQPIFLVNCSINESWNSIITKVKNAKDYNSEVTKFYSVPGDVVINFIDGENLTDAAYFHIYNSIDCVQKQCSSKDKYEL